MICLLVGGQLNICAHSKPAIIYYTLVSGNSNSKPYSPFRSSPILSSQRNQWPLALASVLKSGIRPPWVGLAAGAWVHIAAGNPYNFLLHSHTLKSVLGYSQQQLTILGIAYGTGENFGLLPAICSNTFPPMADSPYRSNLLLPWLWSTMACRQWCSHIALLAGKTFFFHVFNNYLESDWSHFG